MKFAQLVIGPAGCGKSTYCNAIQQCCNASGRTVHVFNLGETSMCIVHLVRNCCRSWQVAAAVPRCSNRLCTDPAAEEFLYEPSSDIRDLISVDDVVQELDLGPNGCACCMLNQFSCANGHVRRQCQLATSCIC